MINWASPSGLGKYYIHNWVDYRTRRRSWSSLPSALRKTERVAYVALTATQAPPSYVETLSKYAKCGAEGQNRTVDTSLFRAVLYQLSYLGVQAGLARGVSVYRITEEKSTLRFAVAERAGFEPATGFYLCRFSKPVPSATRPPLRKPSFADRVLGCRAIS